MKFFDFLFSKEKKSAEVAKNRLMIMLAHERASNELPFLEDLKKDILEVIKKYTDVGGVNINVDKKDNFDLLELEVTLGNK
jgi:cell division topological specificity factor